VSRSDLVDNIDETGCCDRLFGQGCCDMLFVQVWCMVDALVHGTGLVQVGAWLMHLFMVQVEVQVGAWLMHLFMVQVDYRLIGIGLQ
jgi:hypothetical protein